MKQISDLRRKQGHLPADRKEASWAAGSLCMIGDGVFRRRGYEVCGDRSTDEADRPGYDSENRNSLCGADGTGSSGSGRRSKEPFIQPERPGDFRTDFLERCREFWNSGSLRYGE